MPYSSYLSRIAVRIYISFRYFFVVKKVTKKTFVRINLLVRASALPLYATLLLAAARFTARLLADAPSRRQNSYGLVWLRHGAYGGKVVLFMGVACRWLVCRESVVGSR
jgi:hypothetical protein